MYLCVCIYVSACALYKFPRVESSLELFLMLIYALLRLVILDVFVIKQ